MIWVQNSTTTVDRRPVDWSARGGRVCLGSGWGLVTATRECSCESAICGPVGAHAAVWAAMWAKAWDVCPCARQAVCVCGQQPLPSQCCWSSASPPPNPPTTQPTPPSGPPPATALPWRTPAAASCSHRRQASCTGRRCAPGQGRADAGPRDTWLLCGLMPYVWDVLCAAVQRLPISVPCIASRAPGSGSPVCIGRPRLCVGCMQAGEGASRHRTLYCRGRPQGQPAPPASDLVPPPPPPPVLPEPSPPPCPLPRWCRCRRPTAPWPRGRCVCTCPAGSGPSARAWRTWASSASWRHWRWGWGAPGG